MLPVNAAARAVSFDAAIHRRARQILPPRLLDDRFVQRLALPAIVFTEVNANHLRRAAEPHDGRSVEPTPAARRCVYLMTSTSESTTSPSCTICSSVGRYARIFASSSTTDSMIGRSLER